MPYEKGQSLRDKLAKEGELPIGEALRILRDVVDALTAAHAHGVVHRDIKPENILLSGRHALVTDFGVAKAVSEATGREQLTTAGVALGTPAYMAPEQAAANPHLDHRVDIYAVGAVAYELLTGRPVFMGTTPQMILSAHVTEAPQPVTKHRDTVPTVLEAVVMRCLEKKPADRWQSAEELLPQLEALTTPSGGITPTGTTPVVSARGARMKLALIVTVVALVLAAIVVTVATPVLRGPRPTPLALGTATRVTQMPGLELDPSLSPDGSLLAYVVHEQGRAMIYVRQLAGASARPVIEGFDGDARWPRWSPDGQTLAFVSGERLYTVPAFGGVPRLLWEGLGKGPVRSPAWSPDGERMAYAQGNHIFVGAIAGSLHESVAEANAPHGLAWSRDGAWISFASGNEEYMYGADWQGASSISMIPSAGGDVIDLVSDGYLNVSPAWSPAERVVFYVSNKGGGRDIYAIGVNNRGVATGVPERITVGSDIHSIHIAAESGLLAYSQMRVEANLRSFQLPERTPADVTELEDITVGAQVVVSLTVSPNGDWIAFSSDRSGNYDIYKMHLDGGDPIRLTTDPSDDFIGHGGWSPDGTEIAFHSMRTGNRDVFIMSADGGPAEQVTYDPAEDRSPTWSPAGTDIAWTRDGRGLYVVSRTGLRGGWSEERLLHAAGGRDLAYWSPCGRYIAHQGPGTVTVVQSESGEPVAVWQLPGLSLEPDIGTASWAPDGNALYYVDIAAETGFTLRMVQVQDGAVSHIANIAPLSDARIRAMHVHGSRVFLTAETSESNIWVAELLQRD